MYHNALLVSFPGFSFLLCQLKQKNKFQKHREKGHTCTHALHLRTRKLLLLNLASTHSLLPPICIPSNFSLSGMYKPIYNFEQVWSLVSRESVHFLLDSTEWDREPVHARLHVLHCHSTLNWFRTEMHWIIRCESRSTGEMKTKLNDTTYCKVHWFLLSMS